MKVLKKEIDAILSNKLGDAVKAYQAKRDQDLEELVALKKALETLETETAGIVESMVKLNPRKARELGERNRLDVKLRWINRQTEGKKGQIAVLMEKLTEIEVDPKTLTLLLNFKGVKDA